jgi:hypothetical protein
MLTWAYCGLMFPGRDGNLVSLRSNYIVVDHVAYLPREWKQKRFAFPLRWYHGDENIVMLKGSSAFF